MLFSSNVFIIYFLPIMLLIYYLCSFSKVLKNGVLLIGSLFFYAWGEPQYIILIIISIIINYLFGLIIDKYKKDKNKSKIIIVMMLIFNVSILFYYKYLGFIVRNINENLNINIHIKNRILPIGISFFTFQAISYVIDIYKERAKVQKNPFYLGLYISFFPQLVAGPIVRYSDIADQIINRKETWQKISSGICRFIIGLSKKVIIANSLATVVDRIYIMNAEMTLTTSLAWLGAILYTLQIYYDFSGYSDMAIGLGLIFGFKFDENFNYPYISKSVSEFWRRWHISLGKWFKDYVYIPLGGSRVKNKDRIIKNLLIVWLLTGIWHGAEWNFFIWGIYNFIFIAIEKIISFEQIKCNKIVKHLYLLFVINIGWVIFRSADLIEAGNYISTMFGFRESAFWSSYTFMFIRENIVFILIGFMFSIPIARRTNEYIVTGKRGSLIFDIFYPFCILFMFLICVTYLAKGTYNPFIYFNF